LETYSPIRPLVDNPRYEQQREQALSNLDIQTIDPPIRGVIAGFAKLPYCFTLQSCYGHFLYEGQSDDRNTEPLPASEGITTIEYRIAYIALCIQDSPPGRELFDYLSRIPAIDPDYVQWCSSDWFWDQQVNSYALQVEPDRFKAQDTATVDYREALHIQEVKTRFFRELVKLLQHRLR